jgi:hypothetical protein
MTTGSGADYLGVRYPPELAYQVLMEPARIGGVRRYPKGICLVDASPATPDLPLCVPCPYAEGLVEIRRLASVV